MRTRHRWMIAGVALLLAGCSEGSGEGGPGIGTGSRFGTVSGRVTAGLAGLPDVVVSVSGAGSVATGPTGVYQVPGVPTGPRTVTLTLPPGYITAGAADGTDRTVTVSEGQTATASFALKAGVEITASGTTFSPAAVTLPVGGTVRWVNGGGSHTVTPDAGAPADPWQSASLGTGTTFEHTFGATGTYGYHCTPHQAVGMTGTITVTAP